METNPMAQAEEYYTQIGKKNGEGFKKHLHPDVEFYGPLASLKGKEAVTKATGNFMHACQSFKIRTKFGAGDQAMVVYDVQMPDVEGEVSGASLLRFRDGLIIRIELFYDGSRVKEKKEEIFS